MPFPFSLLLHASQSGLTMMTCCEVLQENRPFLLEPSPADNSSKLGPADGAVRACITCTCPLLIYHAGASQDNGLTVLLCTGPASQGPSYWGPYQQTGPNSQFGPVWCWSVPICKVPLSFCWAFQLSAASLLVS